MGQSSADTEKGNMKVFVCLSVLVAGAASQVVVGGYHGRPAGQVSHQSVSKPYQGSYSVALPDGRTQHVAYKADGYAGYVADVTYDGTAVYPDAPAPYHAAPVPAYAG